MTNVPRRTFIVSLASAAAFLKSFWSPDALQGATQGMSGETVARRRAIIALRVLNNAQKHYWGQTHASGEARYGSLEEIILTKGPTLQEQVDGVNESAGHIVFDLPRWMAGGDLVPGFALIAETDEAKTTYSHWLVSRTDHKTYMTDQVGIIYIGAVELAESRVSASPRTLAGHFSGAPLEIQGDGVARGAARRLFDSISNAMFPVLSAQSGSYCCTQVCPYNCVGGTSCGTNCHCLTNDGDCCNTGGVTSCIWCCHENCFLQCSDWRCCDCVNNCGI